LHFFSGADPDEKPKREHIRSGIPVGELICLSPDLNPGVTPEYWQVRAKQNISPGLAQYPEVFFLLLFCLPDQRLRVVQLNWYLLQSQRI